MDGAAQSRDAQIENLKGFLEKLGPLAGRFDVRGGYTMANDAALADASAKLAALGSAERDAVLAALRVGVQTDAQVTALEWGRVPLQDPDHVVTQVFGSACSVAYERPGRKSKPRPRPRRGYAVETSRGAAAATTWRCRGDESRLRRGRDADTP